MLFPFSILSIKLMNKVAKRIFYTSYFSAVWIIIIPLDSQKVGITSSKGKNVFEFLDTCWKMLFTTSDISYLTAEFQEKGFTGKRGAHPCHRNSMREKVCFLGKRGCIISKT